MNLQVFHIDFNSTAFRPDALEAALCAVAAAGCSAILWEVEDKVR